MIEKEQQLLARVLDLFAQRFDKKAVLRGGMVLRVLGSPRLTNDLDYIFVPYKSKKDIVDEIVTCLRSIEGADLDYSINSKCLRVALTVDQTTIQVEVRVAMDVKTTTTSTRLFSSQFDLPPRMIHVVDTNIALANKMAAWNERRLVRDIYDIWFLLQMSATPDTATLERRLRKSSYSRLVKKEDYFPGRTCSEFYEFLRGWVAGLSEKQIEDELSDYLPPEETSGLALLFRAALARLL
ncbi:MAG: nucleotidyl transferase AbiEii/AbiGii toxin family protein [Verrucomicrobia bacterium]|nr:nucleotidyl transferase AbiEii/AbiGii toxin family protein [Verrucomicrobiota bacterium]MDA1088531.1 nucleotidyl transferase AbiEii/AbiGii toxin family protein [Verrucomicrobiota bacterium]